MRKLGGSGLFVGGIFVLILGFVLRWDLIAWLIDVTGLLLIIIGAVMLIVGLIQVFTGGGKSSSYSDDF